MVDGSENVNNLVYCYAGGTLMDFFLYKISISISWSRIVGS